MGNHKNFKVLKQPFGADSSMEISLQTVGARTSLSRPMLVNHVYQCDGVHKLRPKSTISKRDLQRFYKKTKIGKTSDFES